MEHAEILLVVGPLIHEGIDLVLNCNFWSGILWCKHKCIIKQKYFVNCYKKNISGETRCVIITQKCNMCIRRIKSNKCTWTLCNKRGTSVHKSALKDATSVDMRY